VAAATSQDVAVNDGTGTLNCPITNNIIDTQNVQYTNNNNTINNNNNNNQTNIENQININLVVYQSNPHESIKFQHDHIDPKKFRKHRIKGDKVHPDQLSGIVRHYTEQLLSNKDNHCVKKTNMRSSHSQVHLGNNSWETRLDKEVYPNMMNSIATDFSGYFTENYRKQFYTALDDFLEYMASDGYCADDDDKKIENSFKTLARELKLRVFDKSKNKMVPAVET
jgi:hypothetical protein